MRTVASWCITLAMALAVISSPARAARFTVVALPDTQNYSEYHPGMFTNQTNWIKANVSGQGLVFVTHLGDITNEGWKDAQWTNARTSMQVLNGFVPYGLCPGNHDHKSSADVYESTEFVNYFGPSYLSGCSWYGGASSSGFSSFQIITAGGYSLLFLHMDCGAPDSEISWAKSVLSSHSGMPTILTTHEYLTSSQRDRGSSIPGRNSGEAMWNKLIRQYDQIVCVLCGHVFSPDGWHRQISVNNAGRKVYEMMSDYQDIGNGWLRLITFDTTAKTIGIKTYSPFLNQYMTDAGNQFTYSIDLGERFAPTTSVKLLRPQLISKFASGIESWTRVGDTDSTLVWKSDAEGKGYLLLTDGASGTEDYFASPAQFRGDLSQYDALTLDYRVFTASADPDPIHIRLFSGSQYYDWANTERVVNDGEWERLVASLKDADLWTAGGGATEAFSSFITHISGVRVFADIVGGAEQNAMDNFSLAKHETVERVVASSTFDVGMDSWTVDADGERSFDNHGAIMGSDLSTGGTWYFCAPSKFLGDKSACFGGVLEFDLKQLKVDNQVNNADVVLTGGGLTLNLNNPVASNPDTAWTHYTIPLSAGGNWVNQSTGRVPTVQEFLTVLSSLTSLRICGEYRSGADSAWLDNVVVTSAVPLAVSSIGQARKRAEGTTVQLVNPTVATTASTTFSDGSYYIEEVGRTSGIRVVPVPGLRAVYLGDRVTGSGMIRTDAYGNPYIRMSSVNATPGDEPRPVALVNRTVLNELDASGLLVTMWGKPTYVEPATPPQRPSYVYIDDGSGLSLDSHMGIKVILDGLTSPIYKNLDCDGIIVTGLLTKAMGADGAVVPVIRPRSDDDIMTYDRLPTAPIPAGFADSSVME